MIELVEWWFHATWLNIIIFVAIVALMIKVYKDG